MSAETNFYKNSLYAIFSEIEAESEALKKAASILADAIQADRMVHIIGPGGHSNMAAEEMLWRAGGLLHINPILDAGTNLIHGAKRSNIVERTPGYAVSVLDAYGVGREQGEVMLIVNAYGINSMTIDTVLACKERGVRTIAVTSRSFADTVPAGHKARHPSGKNLYEEADVFINNHLPLGDAIVKIDGLEDKVCSTSTFCNCFTLHCIIMETIKELVGRGIEPPVLISANMPNGDAHNRALEEKYRTRVKHLY